MNEHCQEKLVSVCCLGYKHKEFLADCIESIWGQDYRNIEIIAMDDGSKDGSDELLDELSKKSPFPMVVLKQENTGNIGFNVNKLIGMASGKFIMFTSLDDFLTSTSVSDKIYDMIQDENIVFNAPLINYNISGDFNAFEKTLKDGLLKEESPLLNLKNITINDLIYTEYSNMHSFYVQGVLFRKKFIDDIGGFDNDMIGDDIILRTKLFYYIKQNNLKFLLTDKIGMCYRIHHNNIHKNAYRQILAVTQWLDRYFNEFDNPIALRSLLIYALKHYENNIFDCFKYLKIKRLKSYRLLILTIIIKKFVKKYLL